MIRQLEDTSGLIVPSLETANKSDTNRKNIYVNRVRYRETGSYTTGKITSA